MISRDRLALGITALRSGLYRRGREWLHAITRDGETWCCLGVLTDVAIAGGLDITRHIAEDLSYEVFGDSPVQRMLPAVAQWYGFTYDTYGDPWLLAASGSFVHASNWNDYGDPDDGTLREDFTDIADAFERTYLEETP